MYYFINKLSYINLYTRRRTVRLNEATAATITYRCVLFAGRGGERRNLAVPVQHAAQQAGAALAAPGPGQPHAPAAQAPSHRRGHRPLREQLRRHAPEARQCTLCSLSISPSPYMILSILLSISRPKR